MSEPKHLEDLPKSERAQAEADAFAEADELEVKEVAAVDTVAAPKEDPEQ